jgi:hypothetical protein
MPANQPYRLLRECSAVETAVHFISDKSRASMGRFPRRGHLVNITDAFHTDKRQWLFRFVHG